MENILEIKNLEKTFPEVQALKGISFCISKGEVHALLGENGAGKSTLVKIVAGAQTADPGSEIFYRGKKVYFSTPIQAMNDGISVIYQEFNLVSYLSVAENIFLGREPLHPWGAINWGKLHDMTHQLCEPLGLHIDPGARIEELGVAQKQMVEIAKALSQKAELLFMDEPTASLTDEETQKLFKIIRDLKEKGVTIVYISHHLEEIFEITDTLTVLRDGEWIGTKPTKDVTMDELIQMMVGRKLVDLFPGRDVEITDEVLLDVRNVNRGDEIQDVNFKLCRGEILGFAGLMGAGRTEVMRILFGADKKDSAQIKIKGKDVTINSPVDALKEGLALVPEDRKDEGLVMELPVDYNTTLGNMNGVCKANFFIDHLREFEVVQKYIEEINIKTPSHHQVIKFLSGGNQQKVVVAKWLFIPSHIIIFDDPTRGIDIGAKFEIYKLMNKLVGEGIGVILISSDLPEAMGMCDRIVVMRGGRITKVLQKEEFSQETIMKYATGG
ncbi:MAG: sugar ABC transporter ATP-binding protein [Candidatus Eremiobacteraeota bacterium]|nr:sugar ABC transporter ATP-binding protein [Candidatus Eremiobacteraeota bacterium]